MLKSERRMQRFLFAHKILKNDKSLATNSNKQR